jgi:putative two-component system response regulator
VSASDTIQQPHKLLVVDDEDSIRNALTRFLSARGYSVGEAANGEEALQALGADSYAIMLLDVNMPGMSGIDLVPEALDQEPDLAILMLSAVTDATTAAACMQRGAYDYLTKPIELTDLGNSIERALKRRDTMMQNRGISSWLKEEVERQTQEAERERERQQQLTIATLETLINAQEATNLYLNGHSARVAAFAASVAHHLSLSDDEVEDIRMAGRLHDLGKIGVRESVLNKKGRLTDEEYEHVKQHVLIGWQILAPLQHLGSILSYVRSHHEHWCGSGYPDGLVGEEIPLGARVLCASDVYDALTTSRPYQEKLLPEEAVERMLHLSGKIIDPMVLAAMRSAVDSHRALIFIDDEGQSLEQISKF